MSDPKFYRFDPNLDSWPDLMPGDCFVAPYATLWRMDDWFVRGNPRTKIVSTRNNPLLVLARINDIVGGTEVVDGFKPDEPTERCYTIVVFSVSKGFLIAAVKLG